jgi:hypothetical protein
VNKLGLQHLVRLEHGLLWGEKELRNARETMDHGKKFTDDTVDRSPVGHVLVPYDRVDELQQASKTGPDQVQARARIPSYAVHS